MDQKANAKMITKLMFRRFLPLQCVLSALLIIFAVPLTSIYYRDPSEPVYMMTVWGFRIKDDCVPFSPAERQELAEDDDPVKNIGIRMVFGMARDVKYQNVMGLNVLTIRI